MRRISIFIYLTALGAFANAQHQTIVKINQEAPVVQSKSILINQTPERVWNILADVENWTMWNSKIKKVSL